jgi:hypothetical protein
MTHTSPPTPVSIALKGLQAVIADAEATLKRPGTLPESEVNGLLDALRNAETRFRPLYLRQVARGISPDENTAMAGTLELSGACYAQLVHRRRT